MRVLERLFGSFPVFDNVGEDPFSIFGVPARRQS